VDAKRAIPVNGLLSFCDEVGVKPNQSKQAGIFVNSTLNTENNTP
jgi:hypothetical protein